MMVSQDSAECSFTRVARETKTGSKTDRSANESVEMAAQVRMSVLSLRSLDRVAPTDVAFTTILFPVSASSSGMVVVKETETTSPLYKPVSRGVEEMAVFFHQEVLALYRMRSPVIAKPSSRRGPITQSPSVARSLCTADVEETGTGLTH